MITVTNVEEVFQLDGSSVYMFTVTDETGAVFTFAYPANTLNADYEMMSSGLVDWMKS